jgi:NTE family protein
VSVEPGGTVFALAGGGNLGAVQVGMLYALLEAGIRPDAIVGTSVGALNGAFLAGHADLAGMEELADLWASVRRQDVFPMTVGGLTRGLFGRRNFLFESLGLRSLILRSRLGFDELEEAPIPLHMVATDLLTGAPVVLSRGSATEALMASAAIPGIFPPVDVDGRPLCDGGVVSNVPVLEADALEPSTIYVLPTLPEEIPLPSSNALVMMQRAMILASLPSQRQRLELVGARRAVRVLPVPDVASQISIFDFKSTARLIDEAYDMTVEWLGGRPSDVEAGVIRVPALGPSETDVTGFEPSADSVVA